MTDSDREKREWTIWVCKDCEQLAHGPGSRCAKDRRRTWTQMTDVRVVPLERAQELKRERDAAVAAAREMAKVIIGQARVMQDLGLVQAPAAMHSFLSRWPSFLPPDREE